MKSLSYQNGFSMKEAVHDPPTISFSNNSQQFSKKICKKLGDY